MGLHEPGGGSGQRHARILKLVSALAFDGVIERACHDSLAIGVKVQRHNFCRVAQ